MEHARHITGLPVIYQQLLELIDEGRSDEEIACRIGIDVLAVRPMARLAEAKLARLAGGAT